MSRTKRFLQSPLRRLLLLVLFPLLSSIPALAQSGTSIKTAIPLGVISQPISASGTINSSSPIQYYKFTVAGSVRAVTVGIPGDLLGSYVYAYLQRDTHGTGIGETLQSEQAQYNYSQNEMTLWLDPGDYYVRIEQFGNYNTTYVISISQALESDSPGNGDNTLRTARPIAFGQTIEDYVGNSDPIDYYKFTVAGSVRAVTVGIPGDHLGSDVNAYVQRDSRGTGIGETLQSEQAQYNYSQNEMTLWLDPGDYYVRIEQFSDYNTTYAISISQVLESDSPGNGDNTLRTARPIAFGQTIEDYVGNSDPIDYYKFTVAGSVRAVTVGIPGDLLGSDVNAYVQRDSRGTGIGETLQSEQAQYNYSQNEMTLWLDPGDYYVRIEQFSDYNTTYAISISQVLESDSPGNGDNTLRTARPIAFGQTIEDYVGNSDPIDYYKFTVAGSVRAVTVGIPGDHLGSYVNAYVQRDSRGTGIGETLQSEHAQYNYSQNEMTLSLDPGDYYVRIEQSSDYNTTYTLALSGQFTTPTAPFITSQPVGAAITNGQSATFSVVADGSGPYPSGQGRLSGPADRGKLPG